MILSSVQLYAQPQSAARRPRSQPETPDLGGVSPCEVLELSARQSLPRQVLLDALALVGTEVVNSVPAPILRATVLAARAAHQDPKADKVVKAALDDSLNVWHTRHRYSLEGGRLAQIYQGADFHVIGKEIHFPLPSSGADAGLKEAVDSGDVGQMSSAIRNASRNEIEGVAEQLAQLSSGQHAEHSGYSQVAVLQKLLVARPELASDPRIDRELGALIHGLEGTEPAAELAITFLGPGRALDHILADGSPRPDQLKHITEAVRHTNWLPQAEQVADLVRHAIEEGGRFSGHNCNFSALCSLLAAVEQRQPGAVSLADRERLQDALLGHPEPLWPAYAGNHYPDVSTLVVGEPSLKDRMMGRLHEPAAPSFLLNARLNEGEWATLKLEIRKGPRVNNDHTPGELSKADLRRRLEGLTARESVDQLDELAAKTGTADYEARRILMGRLLAQLPAGDHIHLHKLSGWGSDLDRFYPVFARGVREDNLAWQLAQVEHGLAQLSKGLVGGHEPAVAGLALLPSQRPMKQNIQRYRIVLKHIHDGHGTIGASVHAPRLLALLDDVPTKELAKHLGGIGRLKERNWKSGECLDAIYKAVEDAPPERGFQLLNQLLGAFPADQFEECLGFYQTIKSDPRDPEESLQLFNRIKPHAPSGGEALALLPAVSRLALRQEDALALLERIHDLHGTEPYGPAAAAGLAALERGASLREALAGSLKMVVLSGKQASSAGIAQQDTHLLVGGTALRTRRR